MRRHSKVGSGINDASRYDHRIHGVLLVAWGMTCPRVVQLLGDSRHTIVNQVRRFETERLTGIKARETLTHGHASTV